MGWEWFCVRLLGLRNTQGMSKSPQHVCVCVHFEKRDSEATCVWACAGYGVCFLHICSFVWMCSVLYLGNELSLTCSHTRRQKSGSGSSCLTTVLVQSWAPILLFAQYIFSPWSAQTAPFSCTAHVSPFKQLNMSSRSVYSVSIGCYTSVCYRCMYLAYPANQTQLADLYKTNIFVYMCGLYFCLLM